MVFFVVVVVIAAVHVAIILVSFVMVVVPHKFLRSMCYCHYVIICIWYL